MIWLLIGYMWLFIHRPFEIWPVFGTYHVERVYIVVTIVCWLVTRPALPRGNRLHWCFAAFVLAMVASWLQSPYQDAGLGTVENYLKYVVFYILLVTTVRDEKGLERILVGYVAAMTLWMVHSLREYLCGNKIWAQGLIRLIPVGHTYDFNDFAGLIVCSLPLVWALWPAWRTRWKRLALLGYFGFSCVCIVMTSSRMGFIGLVLAGGLACLASPRRWRLLPLFPVVLAVAWIVLPEGQKDRYYTLFDPDYKSVHGASSMGSYRYESLEKGLDLLQQRPLFGFGPQGTGMVSGSRARPHNLYGELLGEYGLAGTIAFALIIWGVAQNAFEARRIARGLGEADDRLAWRTVLAASASFILLLIMGWGFNFLMWHVWLWFGGFQLVALHCLKQRAAFIRSEEGAESELPPLIATARAGTVFSPNDVDGISQLFG